MKFTTTSTLASLAAVAAASKDTSTFAVLRFDGDGFLTEGPIDPVVNPGTEATHYHSVMGGSNFGISVEGDQLLDSKCTTAKIKNDKSNYWVPQLFFQDPKDPKSFTKVKLFYMNVYYFFEKGDNVEPFPPGLKMLSGDAHTRSPPKSSALQLDPNLGEVNPVQWTCPRSSYDPPSYPSDSDGSTCGIGDPNNQDAGAGFPLYPCDGYASPLRQDIHFPSCYNPEAGLDDYKNNTVFPTIDYMTGAKNCPEGYKTIPHLFYEVYWNTDEFDDKWTPDGKTQPFVLSNGDATGFSSHGDFIAGWDEDTLQAIIDTCDVGTVGMDSCPDIPGGLNDDMNCKIEPAIGKMLSLKETLTKLPGDNPVTGWGKGGVTNGSDGSDDESDSSATYPVASDSATSSSESETSPAATTGYVAQKQVEQDADTTATAAAAAVTEAAAGGDSNMHTVWDVVTVMTTTTEVAEPTANPQVRRRAPRHNHGHMGARHAHGGRR